MIGLMVFNAKLLMIEGSLDFRAAIRALINTLSKTFPYILISILSVWTNISDICISNPRPPLHFGWVNYKLVSHSILLNLITNFPFCFRAIPILNYIDPFIVKSIFLEFIEN